METKEKNKKLLIVVGVLLLFGGISLAYFVSKVLTNGDGGSTSVTTAVINGATVYVQGVLSFEDLDILPGHKSVSGIKLTATGNNELVPYNLIWKGTNTLTTPLKFTVYKTSEELNVTATCEKKNRMVGATRQLSEECNISNMDRLGSEVASGTINKNDTKVILAQDEFITATSTGDIKYYYVILEYPNLDEDQNYDLEGSIDGEVTVEESSIKPDISIVAVYVVQDNGEYKEVDDIPQSGYQLNTSKSTCSNDTIPGWDTKTHKFYTDNLTKNGTNCRLYFDKYVPTASEIIIANSTKGSGTPDFSKTSCTSDCEEATVGTYTVEDGMYGGTSTYFRGDTTDNYVKFAGFCWRIVRINGDGSIRLIYDGSTCHANGESTADSIAVANVAYNASYNQSNYVGWTYEGTSQRTLSGTNSNAKSQIENWYSTNITGTNANKVADGKYCNDRNVKSGSTWAINGSTFDYAAYARVLETYQPTLSCNSEDVYTLKVGLITADEVEYAGGKNANNQKYYLYNGQTYWTMSPSLWSSSGNHARVFYVTKSGSVSWTHVYNTVSSLRPVINLSSDTTFKSGGNGTLETPYEVN